MAYMRQASLVRRSGVAGVYPGAPHGMGEYDQVGDWSSEFFPPPYDFLADQPAAIPAPILYTPAGLGNAAACRCGGTCGHCRGLGLFDSMDFTTWGWSEWGMVAGGLYLLGSVLGDVGRTKRKISKTVRARQSKAARRAQLQRELEAA